MTVKRRRYGKSGWGFTVTDPETGVSSSLPGVTKILGMLPRDNLIKWAAEATADYAVNNWGAPPREPDPRNPDDPGSPGSGLSAMPWADRLKTLYGARYQITNPAKKRGTEVHRLGERIVAGQEYDPAAIPLELRGYVEAYRQFCDTIEPVPLVGGIELTVASRRHRYCGIIDLVADLPAVTCDGELIPAGRWLLDLKTGEKGVYPEAALQLCGYQHADVFVDPEAPDDERPMDWLKIDRCGVVHISSDDWTLHPVDTGPEVWDHFQRLLWFYERQEDMKAWVGGPAQVADLEPAAP